MIPQTFELRRAIALAACAALMGCSSCPPFRASWYLDEKVPDEGHLPGIYLALLNDSRDAVKLTQVIVNPTGGTTLPFTQLSVDVWERPAAQMALLPPKEPENTPTADQDAVDARYLKRAAPFKARDWLPGQMLVFRVRDANDEKRCSLPVVVQVECGKHCGRIQTVSGALPNYLHTEWIARCSVTPELTP